MSLSGDDESAVSSSQPLQAAQQRLIGLPSYQDELEVYPDEVPDESNHSRSPVATSEAGQYEERSPGQRSSNGPFQVGAEHSSNPSRANSGSGSPFAPQRPNKYCGAPSTWRAWTAPDRELAASVNQLWARDLSIHLYNAFNLKRRERKSKSSRNELGEEAAPERQEDHRAGWKPPDLWTAWPMPPEEVPREGYSEEWEDDEPWRVEKMVQRSSSVLEDVLVGRIARKAGQTFQARQWDDKHTDAEESLPSSTIDQSQSQPHASTDELRALDSILDKPPLKPAIMTDDAKAQQILQPTVRHLLAKVDDLLRGLHHARAAYGYAVNGPAGARTGASTSRFPASRRYKSTKRVHPHRQWSKPFSNQDFGNVVDSDALPSSNDNENQSPRATSQVGRKPSARRPKLGLRDWTDILAIASMTGWDLAVIGRTARRCSELFGEGIVFRTLEEGVDRSRDATYLPVTLTGAAASKVAALYEPNALCPEFSKYKIIGPVVECSRSNQGFSELEDMNNHIRAQHDTIDLPNHLRINNEEMFGGVHIDGFLQPIQGKHTNQAKPPTRRRRKQRKVNP